MKQELHQDLITFGKYKNKNLKDMIKDRNYCRWLLYQEWFQNYEYIYNFVLNYEPLSFFISKYKGESEDFLDYYDYFNLRYGIAAMVNSSLLTRRGFCTIRFLITNW